MASNAANTCKLLRASSSTHALAGESLTYGATCLSVQMLLKTMKMVSIILVAHIVHNFILQSFSTQIYFLIGESLSEPHINMLNASSIFMYVFVCRTINTIVFVE